jgi:lytic murein transglycosylase
MGRRAGIAAGLALALLFPLAVPALAQSTASPAGEPTAGEKEEFRRFIEALWPDAQSAGIGRATFEAAFKGLLPDPKVVALTRKQGEFSRPISAYVTGAVSAARISQGQALAERWRAVLDRVEASDGVPRGVVLAIWASESGYGAASGSFDTIRSLATLAFSGTRKDLFRRELVAALKILDEDHLPREELKGSWAGAMGQPQFMPSSFLAHAVDGDGDGRRDIWRSVPDVLASIAHFFAQSGWKPGLPWGFEVRLPNGIDLSVHGRDLAEWTRMGLTRADGKAFPQSGLGRLFLPAGIEGPAFLVTDNWEAIRAYNTSDAYALAVGVLSDRIAGGPALARPWPTGPVLNGDERREVHRRLAELGLYSGTPDGKFGAQTREAVRRFQVSRGLLPDGYADQDVLTALRR